MNKEHYRLLILLFFLFNMIACGPDDDIDPSAPMACFQIADDATMAAEASISFNAECSKNSMTFVWDFGDGSTSIAQNPQHIYATAGQYKVNLVVSDNNAHTHATSQTVTITASPFIKHSGYIDDAQVWKEGLHLITSTVTIRQGSVTIEPGAQIFMNKEASIVVGNSGTTTVGGALFKAIGTVDKPIVFKPASGLAKPGEWGHIFFNAKASPLSILNYCKIQYGGVGSFSAYFDSDFSSASDHGIISIEDARVSIGNSEIKGASYWGLSARSGGFVSFTNNAITETTKDPIVIHVNAVHTIGTGNTFDGTKRIVVRDNWFTLPENRTWQALSIPYYFEMPLESSPSTVNSATATFTIMPGAILTFAKTSYFSISFPGRTILDGTPDKPIVFTSATDKTAGAWGSFSVGNSTVRNSIIEYASGPGYTGAVSLSVAGSDVFSNNIVRNISGNGIDLVGYHNDAWGIKFENNKIENCSKFGVLLRSEFVHVYPYQINTCTNTKGYYINGGIKGQVTWPVSLGADYVIGGISILGWDTEPLNSLTLQPGTVLHMMPRASIEVSDVYAGSTGTLIAEGTSQNPITFLVSNVDNAANENWGSINFDARANATSKVVYCVLDGGGNDSSSSHGIVDFYNVPAASAPVFHSNVIKNSKTYGVTMSYSTLDVSNNTYQNNTLGNWAVFN